MKRVIILFFLACSLSTSGFALQSPKESSFQINSIMTKAITLAWDYTPTPGVSFRLFWGIAGQPLTNNVSVTITTATINLKPRTTYDAYVVAFDGKGTSGPSNTLRFRTGRRSVSTVDAT